MKSNSLNRRKFVAIIGAGGAALAVNPMTLAGSVTEQNQVKPSTNIADAGKIARTSQSMPGKYPGKVVQVKNIKSVF